MTFKVCISFKDGTTKSIDTDGPGMTVMRDGQFIVYNRNNELLVKYKSDDIKSSTTYCYEQEDKQ